MTLVKEAGNFKKNIVGGKVLGSVNTVEMDVSEAHKVNTEFWSTIGSECLGGTVLPDWDGFFPSEDKLHLLGNLSDKRVLEIGCGNGRSLKYAADLGTKELWGMDISARQIAGTKEFLKAQGIHAELVCSPMENECGLPTDYFDLVYSIYGIGWTTDLNKTFQQICFYLKKDGRFVFGWSHPIHKCVSVEEGKLIFSNSYFNENWYRAGISSKEIILSNRMLSTYINALARNGFVLEQLTEKNRQRKSNGGRE